MCAFAPLMLATTALSAVGSIMQGNQAAAAGEAQRNANYQQADAERIASGYESTKVFEQGRRALSAGIVQTADSGIALTGSPVDVLAENAKQNQMDIDAIRFGSTIKQNNIRTQGDLAFMGGQQRQTAGYLGAATNVASGLASLYTPRASVRMGGSAFA